MKRPFAKFALAPPLLIAAVIALAMLSIFLYAENRSFRNANESLILQNDSIISVNIQLQSALKNRLPQSDASMKMSTGFRR